MHARGGLGRRMAIASGLLTLVLVVGFVAVFLAIRNLHESTQSRRHIRQQLVAANALETSVVDLETGLRGFVITRDDGFLGPWTDARAVFPERAQTLERLVVGEPVQLARIRRIVQDVGSYVRAYSLPLIGAVRRNEPSARSIADTAEGRRRIDAIRAEFSAFLAAGSRTLAARERSADGADRLAIVGAGVGGAGSILLVLLFAGYLTRVIVRPVRRAALLADGVAGGDLSSRMTETGVGELGTLERSLNVMADSLEKDRDELARLADEQAALRRVATLVAQAAPPGELFAAVTKEVGQVLSADLAYMGRYGPDESVTFAAGWKRTGDPFPVGTRPPGGQGGRGIAAVVAETRRPARMDTSGATVRCSVGTPIVVEGRLWGVMIVDSPPGQPLPPDTEARLANFTELVATAVANAESRADLAASRARVVATADETRRRIERDLHDGAQQRLVSLVLELRATQATVPHQLGELEGALSRVADGMLGALDDLREIARGIHPAILAEGGISPALKTLARRSQIPVELDVRAPRLPERVEVATYYVVAETLTNAAKHAQASLVHVDVEAIDGVVRVSVRDDGAGGADPARGSGLIGLKDRVEALGGTISVQSPVGAGTSVHVELPLDGDWR